MESSRESYLATEVLTAAPQKLQLMLVEAAMRAAERARQLRLASQPEQAGESLIRAQELVGQVLAGLNPQADPALAKRVAGIYLFVYRRLAEAALRGDDTALDDALRVLGVERETWRQLCQQLGDRGRDEAATASLPPLATDAGPLASVGLGAGGFSIEA
jgi:flagellar protein FliS